MQLIPQTTNILWFYQNKIISVGPWHILALLLSMTGNNFEAVSSVSIFWLLCICWSFYLPSVHITLNGHPKYIISNTNLSFKPFHSFDLDFHLMHSVITKLNCHFSINFASFYSAKSDRRSLSFFGALCQLSRCYQHVTILSLFKEDEYQLAENEGSSCLYLLFFSVLLASCSRKTKIASFFLILIV
jgi:hypothetical protein